jgi:hypothetical protein
VLPSKTEFEQTGTLPGEKIDMSFDAGSLAHLADVLINLYSDKEKAVIREYSTNARDSHIAAGVKRPIEITTPSYLSYFFKVKDYGVGMSADDIRRIYSKYGASTKRTTNEQTGMLGLGCKSGLTYTDQFTIIAVKDGIKINVAVSRSTDGGGGMTILSETETTDENGVEIVIPVSRNNRFEGKCNSFFQYWPQDSVLINGQKPPIPNLQKISDRLYMRTDVDYYSRPLVVMGGIAYEINSDQIKLPKSLVAFVNIGEVAFQPSREYLHYTPKTMETLRQIHEDYKNLLLVTVQKEIDGAESKYDAIRIYENWAQKLVNDGITLNTGDFTYRGKQLEVKFGFVGRYAFGRSIDMSYYRYSYDAVCQGIIVYRFNRSNLTTYQKQKLNIWLNDNAANKQWFYFCDKIPGNGWLDEVQSVDWTDILNIKISRATPTKKEKPVYELYRNNAIEVTSDIDTSKPILYCTKSLWKSVILDKRSSDKLFPDIQFVFVGENRKQKFLKFYPQAEGLKSGLKNMVQARIDALTDQEKIYLTSDEWSLAKYANLDISKISDPDLVDIVKLSNMSDEIRKIHIMWESICNISYSLGIGNLRTMFGSKNTAWISQRYPLLDKLINGPGYGNNKLNFWEHVYIYLDAAYELYKEGV